MTKSKEEITTNQSQDDKERETYLDKHAELEQAWKEVDDLRTKIGKQDIEIANLKDVNGTLEQQKQNMLQNFQELFNLHKTLEDQVINSLTAVSITSGKLSEALVRCKFIIPESNQQQS